MEVAVLLEASHEGTCRACPRPVHAGDRICWVSGWDFVEHEECSDEGKARLAGIEASYAYDSSMVFPVPEGLSYLPFQKAGIAYALSRPEGVGTIFGDEMGLGKSVEAIGVVNGMVGVKTVLIVCPASLKLNWRNEAQKWVVRTVDVQVDAEPLWRISLETSPDTIRIQIINYEEFPNAVRPSSYYDIIIYDEAHYIKNPDSIRGKFARRMARRCKRVLCLTGTPIPNHVIDIFPLLQVCDPTTWDPAGRAPNGTPVEQGFGAGLIPFADRYCNRRLVRFGKKGAPGTHQHWDMSGHSNLDELHDRLRSTCMVRRLKRDVLKELPDKRRQVLVFPLTDEAMKAVEWEKRVWDSQKSVLGDFDGSVEDLAKARGIDFTEMSAARKAVGMAKALLVADYVQNTLSQGDEDGTKILLFAHHDDVISKLVSKLGAYNPAIIRGYTSIELRQAAVERFQSNTDCRLFVGSIGAAGVGLTLTASSHVVFAEESWSHKDVSQVEDRAHRIGQKKSVLVTHIVFDDSLDANMMKKVVAKQEASDAALDRR